MANIVTRLNNESEAQNSNLQIFGIRFTCPPEIARMNENEIHKDLGVYNFQ